MEENFYYHRNNTIGILKPWFLTSSESVKTCGSQFTIFRSIPLDCKQDDRFTEWLTEWPLFYFIAGSYLRRSKTYARKIQSGPKKMEHDTVKYVLISLGHKNIKQDAVFMQTIFVLFMTRLKAISQEQYISWGGRGKANRLQPPTFLLNCLRHTSPVVRTLWNLFSDFTLYIPAFVNKLRFERSK